MAKAGLTYVAQEKFLKIVDELGLVRKEQKGFIKVWDPKKGENAQRLYVAKTKSVGRVDLSHFEVQFGGVDLGGEKFGGVSQQLNMCLPEEDILTNFRALCEHMAGLPAPEPKAKAPKKEAKVEGEAPAQEDPRKSRYERLKKTIEITAKRGGEVSEEIKEEFAKLEEELSAPAAQ